MTPGRQAHRRRGRKKKALKKARAYQEAVAESTRGVLWNVEGEFSPGQSRANATLIKHSIGWQSHDRDQRQRAIQWYLQRQTREMADQGG